MLVFLEYNALMIQYINIKKEKKSEVCPGQKVQSALLKFLWTKLKEN